MIFIRLKFLIAVSLLALTLCRADDSVTLHGTLQDSQGKMITAVSRLQFFPLKIAEQLPPNKLQRFQQAIQTGDGHFSVTLPAPGQYRALVDIDDLALPPTEGSLINVTAGENNVIITVPPPLLTVPSATEIRYTFRNSTLQVHTITPSDNRRNFPLYGYSDEISSIWFHDGDETLVVGEISADDKISIGRRVRRKVSLTIVDAQGKPYPEFLTLAALFPPTSTDRTALLLSTESDSSATATSLNRNRLTKLSIWPGKYAVLDRSRPAKLLAIVEIPAQGPEEITIAAMDFPNQPTEIPMRVVMPEIPIVPPEQRIGSASYIKITADSPSSYHNYISLTFDRPTFIPETTIPAEASSLTFYWPGVGVIRDVALPLNTPLADWRSESGISGILQQQDGTPVANKKLCLGEHAGPGMYTASIETDDVGHFTAHGLPPGMIFITLAETYTGWVRNISAVDKEALILQIPKTKYSISYNIGPRVSFNQYWWIPLAGKARRLFGYSGNGSRDLDLQKGEGWFWSFDQSTGSAICSRVAISDENAGQSFTVPYPGPSLAITMPLTAEHGQPGKLILDGLANLADIHVEYPSGSWQYPCPEKGVISGEITALPPGSYQITVETTAGNVTGKVDVGEFGGAISLNFPEKR